jgi:hypothetical protein
MEDVSKGWATLPGFVENLVSERDRAKAKMQRANALLYRAESFLLGFEDDDTQEGVKELLRAIREEADVVVTFATTDQRNAAYSQWVCDLIEFDDPVRVSQADGGFWALGWLWVDDANEED